MGLKIGIHILLIVFEILGNLSPIMVYSLGFRAADYFQADFSLRLLNLDLCRFYVKTQQNDVKFSLLIPT